MTLPAWWVYVVRCADGTLYTGIARDPAGRVATHNAGRGARYTRSRRPVALVFSEPATDRGAALRREAAIKRLPAEAKRQLVTRPA
jgi:putative endonuclease